MATSPPRASGPRRWRPSLRGAWTLAVLAAALGCQAQPVRGDDDAPPPASRPWDASLGLALSHGPEYPGAERWSTGIQPGFALRWGRVSFASRSAFATRRSDTTTVAGGLRIEVAEGRRWRVGLGLRMGGGRKESDSAALTGMGDLRQTLLWRLSGRWDLAPGWRASAVFTADALGRGRGLEGEVGVGWDRRLSARTTGSAGLTVGWGSQRWLQNQFGVTPQQAARTGYAPYAPRAGWHDAVLSAGVRTEWDLHWVSFAGASVSTLLDRAAASPLTRERHSAGLSAGWVYRF